GIWTSVESASGARYHVLRLLPAGRTLRQHGGGALGVAERIGETALESIAFGGGEGGEPLVPGTRPRKREVPQDAGIGAVKPRSLFQHLARLPHRRAAIDVEQRPAERTEDQR